MTAPTPVRTATSASASASSASAASASAASADARPALPLPSIHMRALLTWIAVFTALSVVQTAIGPYVAGLPLPLRTLVITGVVVPAVVYGVVPTLLKARAALLRRRLPTTS